MCKVMEDMRNEAVEKRNIEFANTLLKLGKLTVEEIAASAGLTYSSARFFYLHFYPVKPNLIGTF